MKNPQNIQEKMIIPSKNFVAEVRKIARSRFELLSGDPESPMIDRYTTGLCASYFLPLLPN